MPDARPVPLPGGALFVPPGLLGTLKLALRQLQSSAPRIRTEARSMLDGAREAAVLAEQAAHHAAGFASATFPQVSGRPPVSRSAETVTVRQAVVMLGISEQMVRRLAAAGRVDGEKGVPGMWALDAASVAAYGSRRRRRGNGGYTPPEGEGHRGRSGGGTAAA